MKKAKDFGAAAIDTVIAFKLVYVRVAFYFLTPAVMLFLTQTETYGQDTWNLMGPFLRTRLYLACMIAGATSFCAYIDSSLQRAKERGSDMKDKRDALATLEQSPAGLTTEKTTTEKTTTVVTPDASTTVATAVSDKTTVASTADAPKTG